MQSFKINLTGFIACCLLTSSAIFLITGDDLAWQIIKYAGPLDIGLLIALILD